MYKKVLLICLIPLCMQATEPTEFVFHTPKTSGKTALLTAGTGIGTALATHYGIASLLNFFEVTKIPVNLITTLRVPVTNWLHLDFTGFARGSISRNVTNGMVVFTAGAVGTLAAWLMYAYQPEGKFTAARNKLVEAVDNDLLNELLNAQNNLLKNIDNEYIEFTYPRVAAHGDFVRFHTSLKQATQWLKEAIIATNDDKLVAMAEDYISIIEDYMEDISACVQIIRNEPDWLKQLKGNELQKTREAQERLAFATQMAAFNNHHVYVYR